MNSHKESFMTLEELGTSAPPYYPTYDFPNGFIDETHKFINECPVDNGLIQIKSGRNLISIIMDWLIRGSTRYAASIQIKNYFRFKGAVILGWLGRGDALKLYEMGYFSSGDILELGSHNGLSTSLLSNANRNSPYKKRIYSVDLNPSAVKVTNCNLKSMRLEKDVITIYDDAVSSVKKFASEGKKFKFVFIDHSHAYEPMYGVCHELKHIVAKGGFCLFHDFNNLRNRDPDDKEYDVYQAVMDCLSKDDFEFYGIYETCGLYREI